MTARGVSLWLLCPWLLTTGAGCSEGPPVARGRSDAPSAAQVAVTSTSTPASTPATLPASTPAPASLCDKIFEAGKGPTAGWPPPGTKAPPLSGPVWVNLWAGWCKPCIEEIPRLVRWSRETGTPLVLVSLDDDAREWKQAVEKHQLAQHQVVHGWLPSGAARAKWLKPLGFGETPSLPQQLILDSSRRLRCLRGGAVDEGEAPAFAELLARVRLPRRNPASR